MAAASLVSGLSSVSYRIERKKSAQKEIDELEESVRKRVLAELDSLAENPRHPGTLKMKGGLGYRARVGDFRIIYDIDDAAQLVTVLTVADRSGVYK